MLLHEKIRPYRLLLASASPRRRALLHDLGLSFTVVRNNQTEEKYPPALPASQVAEYLACQKAAAYHPALLETDILLTADTVVCIGNLVLGKPSSEEEAAVMLRNLSGHCHQVYTGVCLRSVSEQHSFTEQTDVHFKELTEEEIQFYIQSFKPLDKAGAYGIQEWIGFIGIERIEGSYQNVIGLPVQRLYRELSRFIG